MQTEQVGRNRTTPLSLASHSGLIISLHFSLFVQDVKYQSSENENNSGNPQTHSGNLLLEIWLFLRQWGQYTLLRKRSHHPNKSSFPNSWQFIYNISLLYRLKKRKYIWSIWHCGIYMSTDKNLRNSQVRLWCCIPLLFRYINNQIWRAAKKKQNKHH